MENLKGNHISYISKLQFEKGLPFKDAKQLFFTYISPSQLPPALDK